MVAHRMDSVQGLRPQVRALVPLSLEDVRWIAAHPPVDPELPVSANDLLIYLLLALHADCLGNVTGKIADIAALAWMSDKRARPVIWRLVRNGFISRKVYGTGRRLTVWHINAVHDETAA